MKFMKEMSPNPLFERNYLELRDGWLFSLDGETWNPIRVPFCPESELSGICHTDFIPVCYYKKRFAVDSGEGRVFLHFGAVDYRAAVYLNGRPSGEHIGGYTPFSFDITDDLAGEENELLLVVRDGEGKSFARGKQSDKRQSFGCYYTRTTGIWQPVWLERVPEKHIEKFFFRPQPDRCCVEVELWTNGNEDYALEVFYEGKPVGRRDGNMSYRTKFSLALSEKHLWECGKGRLYDVVIKFGRDVVKSYFGLRDVKYAGYDFLLNGEKVFQKLVLEQGYYPDGIYTPRNEQCMCEDIERAIRLGFNGLRLHQKVFDPRYLSLCDRAGVLVWGEFPSWGIDYCDLKSLGRFTNEWTETIERDFNHPCIVTWCPLNEVWGDANTGRPRDVRFIDAVFRLTKQLDSTRPCVDVSGGFHGFETDVYDFHCYETEARLKEYLDVWEEKDELRSPLLYDERETLRYRKGLPVNVSECGGFAFVKGDSSDTETVNEGAVQSESAWGYGRGERDGAAFVNRYRRLAEVLFSYPKLSGFCFTQLYDVEQEQNGFYCYDRTDKLSDSQKDEIRTVNGKR